MWPKQNLEHDLRSLLSQIETASQPTFGLVGELLRRACPRLKGAPHPGDPVLRLIEAKAWVDLGILARRLGIAGLGDPSPVLR